MKMNNLRFEALEAYAATFGPHQPIPTGMSLALPNPAGGPDLKVGSWLKKQRQRRQVRRICFHHNYSIILFLFLYNLIFYFPSSDQPRYQMLTLRVC